MMNLPESRRQSYIRGATILSATAVLVKIIGFVYKIPLLNILGDAGASYFQVPYQIYAVLLAVSTTGIPVALARLISAASATGRPRQARRYFSVALPAFTVLGVILSLLMYFFSDNLAVLMRAPEAAYGIRVLAPAVFFVCLVSVYEGYGQGHKDMIPTAAKQLTEVTSKLVIGLSLAWWLLAKGYDTQIASAGAIAGVPIGLCIALFILIAHKRKADKALSSKTVSYQYDKLDGRLKTLRGIFKVSVPITLGATFMSILTLIDMFVVRTRLNTAAGFSLESVDILYGVYSKALALLILPSALIVPITISIIPAIAASLANRRQLAAKEITDTSLKLTNIFAIPAGLGLCVLSYPIFNVFYWNSNENGPACLTIFGIASYFVCMQLITTAILQANGHERSPAIPYLIGGTAQIIVDYILVGNPAIGIVGSPVGTLTCYFLITILNFAFIVKKVKYKPSFSIFIKPALCSAVMVAAAWSIYELLYKMGSDVIGTGRLALGLFLSGAIIIAIIVYALLIIATKTVTREDMILMPKGEKLADFLRMR